MQQKKSPAMLIVGLCVVLGASYFVNATAFFTKPLLPPPPPKAEAPTADQAAEVTRQAREQMAKQAKGTGAQAGPEGEPTASGIPAEPAIFPPKVQRYDPQFNETSTSGQWYNEESAVKEKGEKVREDRGF